MKQNIKPFLLLLFVFINAFFLSSSRKYTKTEFFSKNKKEEVFVAPCTDLKQEYIYSLGQTLAFNFIPTCIGLIEDPKICTPKLLDQNNQVIAEGYEFELQNLGADNDGKRYRFVVIGNDGNYSFSHSFSTVTQKYALIPKSDIDKVIAETLEQDKMFRWSSVSNLHILSAARYNGNVISVGYKLSGMSNTEVLNKMDRININSTEWLTVKKNIFNEIQKIFNKKGYTGLSVEDVIVKDDNTLPHFLIGVVDLEVIDRLKQLSTVRYVEPAAYDISSQPVSSSASSIQLLSNGPGCHDNSPATNIPDEDYENYDLANPNSAKIPWNYEYHNIQKAWHPSGTNIIAKGDNIKIGLIDTGVSKDQPRLNAKFNPLGNRSIQKKSTYGATMDEHIQQYGSAIRRFVVANNPEQDPYDQCAHGTQMAGVIAAPNIDGPSRNSGMLGVAWESDLVSVRAASDVLLTDMNSIEGVKDAYKILADDPDVKIISMSLGTIWYESRIADAVYRAYLKGKLIFNAAGTSIHKIGDVNVKDKVGVIFPANLDITNAITGIDNVSEIHCNACHKGNEVDFLVVMERMDSRRNTLTLAQASEEPSYVGGSSVATATMAGIAAMVWSTDPSQKAFDVQKKLLDAAERDNKTPAFGYGKVDALSAVQGKRHPDKQ